MENRTDDDSGNQCALDSEEYLKAVLEISLDGFWAMNLDGKILTVNDAYCRMTGYSREELLEKSAWDLDADEDQQTVLANMAKVRQAGYARFEKRHRAKNGNIIDFEIAVAFLKAFGGQLICFCRDISERKKYEARMCKNEASLKMSQHQSHTGSWELNHQTKQLVWSDEVFRIFELDPAIFGASYEYFLSIIHPEDREKVNEVFLKSLHEKTFYHVEHRLLMPDGRIKYVFEFCETSFSESGEPLVSNGTVQDVTTLKQTIIALRESEAKLRAISDNLPDGMVYQIDAGIDGKSRKFTFVSAGVVKLHGVSREEAFRNPESIYSQIHPDDRQMLAAREKECAANLSDFNCEARFVLPDGRQRWALFSSQLRRRDDGHIICCGVEIDITTQKKAEQEKMALESRLHHIQKLESLATLAGGIAHGFNNLFAGVYGNIDLALATAAEPKVIEFLENSMRTIDRARSLTGQLLTFSKGGAPCRKPGNLAACIAESVQLALEGSKVACSFRFADNLMNCVFDRSQIAQAVENIALNARQVMPDGGNLEVTGENCLSCGLPAVCRPGNYVKLTFKDTGPGMSKNILEKIFDPFFSTRPNGPGMGLPTSFSIISQHDGYIEADSEPGVGSIFTIYLPASAEIEPTAAQTVSFSDHIGNGTILVMDDEEI
ncbi:MAG TPA: PAS domain S-box protein, partial [Candidatus Ozemobacteraceae bacterium]|nr:PAS domain S-box protein [Candidatus Ozemobacteraceae bacterium]